MSRLILIAIAAAYTVAGMGALIVGFLIPWDDPLAPVFALMLGAPWTSLLSAVDGYAEDSIPLNVILLTLAIAFNAVLLWWWALTRRRSGQKTSRIQ